MQKLDPYNGSSSLLYLLYFDILYSELIHHFLENFKLFILQSISHSMCLMQGRGSLFGGGWRDFFQKQINTPVKKTGPCKLSDVQLTGNVNCPTIHKIKQFHLSNVPLVHQPILFYSNVCLFMYAQSLSYF